MLTSGVSVSFPGFCLRVNLLALLLDGPYGKKFRSKILELELIQSHMAQKPMLRGEVGCACVAREVSAERGGMYEGFKERQSFRSMRALRIISYKHAGLEQQRSADPEGPRFQMVRA